VLLAKKSRVRFLMRSLESSVDLILQDSVVGIATDYGLNDRGVGVRVQVGSKFSLLHGK
jgi:hypothetical protein